MLRALVGRRPSQRRGGGDELVALEVGSLSSRLLDQPVEVEVVEATV